MSILGVILWSVLILLLTIILWLLLARIRLTIDSVSNTYTIDYQGIAKLSAIPQQQDIKLQMCFFFWTKDQSLLQLISRKRTAKPKPDKPAKKRRKRMSFRKIISKAKRILSSFRVKEFSGTIDTDNYILNAYLYPVFFWLGARKGRFPGVNFRGQNEIKLVIENRLIRILLALIR